MKLPPVDSIRSSPLTKVPVGRSGVPPTTNRNGTSAFARLTMLASHSPASDGACLEHEAASERGDDDELNLANMNAVSCKTRRTQPTRTREAERAAGDANWRGN